MSLHPDIEALLEMIQLGVEAGQRIPFPQLTAAQARADFEVSSPLLDIDPPPLAHERLLSIPTRDGAFIPARLYAGRQPDATGLLPVLLYMHGGGFVVGSLDSHQPLCRGLAADSGAAVLSIGYRLAPEHRFPTAFEDAVDALAWLGKNGREIGLDPSRIAVGGDSAGGTLAAALAIEARDNDALPRPVLQVLAYPGLSSEQSSDSYRRYGVGYLLERDTVNWFFDHYLRSEADRGDWRFAPLTVPDLAALPPALIVLAEYDPLLDEGRAYAERLGAAGVATELTIYPGMIHEFLRMGNITADALSARADIGKALAQMFGIHNEMVCS